MKLFQESVIFRCAGQFGIVFSIGLALKIRDGLVSYESALDSYRCW